MGNIYIDASLRRAIARNINSRRHAEFDRLVRPDDITVDSSRHFDVISECGSKRVTYRLMSERDAVDAPYATYRVAPGIYIG
jgi:hypothetical protein